MRTSCKPRLGQLRVVADQDIVASAAVDRVSASLCCRNDRNDPSQQIDIEGRVAVEDIVASFSINRVVACAAREVVACLAAGDHIIASTAIDGQAAGRCDGVDRVIARIVEGMAVEMWDMWLGVDRFTVADAIFTRIAIDDQRAAGGQDCDCVITATAVNGNHRRCHSLADGEGINAGSKQDFGDFEVREGYAAVVGDIDRFRFCAFVGRPVAAHAEA